MARRYWALANRRVRRGQLFLVRQWRRAPFLRRGLPWFLALGFNVAMALILLSLPFVREPQGLPDAPPNAVTVFVVPPQTPAPIVETIEAEEPPDQAELPTVELEDIAIAESPDEDATETAQEDASPPELPEMDGTGIAIPFVDLPETEIGQGTPDGLVALNCNRQFANQPEKAAECAGREILSGWRANVAELGPEWDKIAEDMRRGGYAVPRYGPDPLAGLGRNTRVFEGEDVRFRNRTFDTSRRYTRSFNSPQEIREYQALQDARRYVGEGGGIQSGYGMSETVPLSGWQPSWQLRDDPNIDKRALDALLRDANE